MIRSWLPGDEEQLYEVDALIGNFHLSLVGAYSLRRRLDFRIERRTSCSKLHVRLAYPAYHGKLGGLLDRWQRGRRVAGAWTIRSSISRGSSSISGTARSSPTSKPTLRHPELVEGLALIDQEC